MHDGLRFADAKQELALPDLAAIEVRERYRVARRLLRDLSYEERLDLLALVVWGTDDGTGIVHANGVHARDERAHVERTARASLSSTERNGLHRLVDERVRALTAPPAPARHCPSCGIWFERGFTAGCESCAARAQERERRARYVETAAG